MTLKPLSIFGLLSLAQILNVGVAETGKELCTVCKCDVGKVKNLTWVDCSSRMITRIPKLPYATEHGVIEGLALDGNYNLSVIDEDTFFNTTGLKELDLDNNKIEKIPELLFKTLAALEKLKLYNTRINEIPSKLFATTPNLKSVQLYANDIKALPENLFYSNPNLFHLDLSQNKITEIPPTFFANSQNLDWLDISKNSISSLPDGLFSKTPRLTYLDMQRNKLKSIPKDLLNCTKDIDYFNIARNEIRIFPKALFNNASRLGKLHINHNKFGTIHPLIFDKTPNLKRLTTSGFTDCCNAERITGRKLERCNFRKKLVESSALQGCGFRFDNGTPRGHFGAVEIYNYEDSSWNTLCSDSKWSMTEAHVLCKDLYFEEAVEVYHVSVNGTNKINRIINKDYFCKGQEDYLSDCKSKIITYNCSTNKVVGVRCKIEGEMLDKVCNISSTTVDCSNRNISAMPWVNNTLIRRYENITSFSISQNKIKRVYRGSLAPFPKVKSLDFSFNKIENLPQDLLFYSSKLENLNFSRNSITQIPGKFFENIIHLRRLDFSYNELQQFLPEILPEENQLEFLNLSRNHIHELDGGKMKVHFRKLKVLDISLMPYLVITDWSFLHKLVHLKLIRASKFDQCCYVKRYRDMAECKGPTDEISDCDDLIKDVAFRSVLWIAMVFVITANVFAFIPRLIIPDGKNSMKIFILNLMVSDFLMGVFLAGILHQHATFEGEYYIYDRDWRKSATCKALGVISLLSSELSLATLTVIGYTRYYSIVHGFSGSPLSSRCHTMTVCVLWVIFVSLALIPAFVESYFNDENHMDSFYGGNALCLPLYLPGEKENGWEYSFAVFGCLNLIAVIYIMGTYVFLFYKVIYKCEGSAPSRSNEDRHLTIRLTLIVMTDLLCWIPVIALLYLSLMSVVSDEDNAIYRWFVVCVFPVNATINPIIYTFLAPRMWKKFQLAANSCGGKLRGGDDYLDRTDVTRSTQRIELDLMNSNSITSNIYTYSSKSSSSIKTLDRA